MMWLINYLPWLPLLAVLGVGHLAIWVSIINRLHATDLPRLLVKAIDKVIYLAVLALPAGLACASFYSEPRSTLVLGGQYVLLGYSLLCLMFALGNLALWIKRGLAGRLANLVSNHTVERDVVSDLRHRPVQGWHTSLAAGLPFNQIFDLHVNVKTLRVPGLQAELDGLSIAHLSDIHMTGRITRPFFDYVVDRTNELEADLVCITGDIVEKVPCLEWLQPTLGRLHARHGKFFVLGNHDKRLKDVAQVRRALADCDLVDSGGRWLLHPVRGAQILLAGNELPWFGPAPDLSLVPESEGALSFRLLLAHTPDQIRWARRNQFQLMLAGHNHGGQICLPWFGPLITPSHYGVKYASGLFQEDDLLLHVSRGVSGLEPLRFNCPPEVTKLVLVRG